MYVTYQMLAIQYGCSEATIRRRVKEMEASEMYPTAVRRVSGVQIDQEQFDRFCTIGRRKKL